MEIGREMPYSSEAEQAIIGSILIKPSCLPEVLEAVAPHNFYIEKNKLIFTAIVELFNSNKPIDVVTLGEKLIENDVYDAVGGKIYLQEIITNVPIALNVLSYAEIVKQKWEIRSLIDASKEIEQACFNNGEANDVMEYAVQKIFDVAQNRDSQGVSHIKPIIYENYNRLSELMKNGNKISGISSGYTDLDQLLLGLQPGQLILIAARPGMGKSSLAVNIAQNAAIRGNIPVAIFNLEMAKEEMVNRIICSEAKISSQKLKTGDINADELGRFIDLLEPIAASPIYIDDTSAISVTELRAKCKRLKLERNIGLVIIDYLQLMQGSGKESRQQEISEISRSLKILAKELSIPVIALSQLSRAAEQRKDDPVPRLSDLRESGAIEQDADIVMFLYREEYYNLETERKNICDCYISKNRGGSTGKVELVWLGEYTTFYNKESSHDVPY